MGLRDPDVMIDAIRTIACGDALLSPAATRGLIARFLTLHDPGPGYSAWPARRADRPGA